MRTLSERLWSRTIKRGPAECWEWQGHRGPAGHGQIQSGLPDRRVIGAHRAAWMLTNGEIPAGLHVLHKCDNPPCCNPAHLFLGTQADNNADCRSKRRSVHFVAPNCFPRGENSHLAKITDQETREIIASVRAFIPRKMIAEVYGITVSAISKIITGKARKHLNPVTA
jgi:hypothetical protein